MKTPQQIRNEVEKEKKIYMKSIIISLVVMLISVSLILFVISFGFRESRFISACQSFGGEYHIFGDGGVEGFVECSVKYPYCQDTCILNGKWYNYYDVPKFNIGKYFCVEDCKYENSNGGNCVC